MYPQKANHWGKMCNTTENPKSGDNGGQKADSRVKPKTKFAPLKQKSVNAMQNEEWSEEENPFESVNFDSLTINSVQDNSNRDTRDQIFVKVNIKLEDNPRVPAILKAKVDSGAQGNVLPMQLFREMYPDKVDDKGYPRPHLNRLS